MDFLKHQRHHSSATSHRSISDADSQLDEFHSPLRADSPLRSDDISSTTSTAIVAVTPVKSPLSKTLNPSHTVNFAPLAKSPVPVGTHFRPVKEEAVSGGGGGGREVMVERVQLGFRVCEMVLCLIAFSVMVSDKTKGWSGDSFDRYKEYRYLVGVNVIAFAYATFQAIDHAYLLVYAKHIVTYSLRCHTDFLIDQILAYLLVSSSSSAATRVDDWVLNWGKDEFTKMASASVVMSFLAFLAFAISSLISGYNLCDQNSF
ncbi:CASP-like protein 4A3 [Bidens hawaiensis]|uniref:CASP-like protein 4A3 n=1 Tax=Bidens hawaiensis TaxID=980011 RepID=UPI0040490DEE